MKRNKRGISLIVLVITIIVMIILAATVMISLSNTGVLDKANEAVDATNLKTAQQIAGLAWTEAYLDNINVTDNETKIANIEKAVNDALEKNGVDTNKYVVDVTTEGVTLGKKGTWALERIVDEDSGKITSLKVTNGTLTLDVGTIVNYMTDGVGDTNYVGGWRIFGVDDDGRLLILSNNSVMGDELILGNDGSIEEAVKSYQNALTILQNTVNSYKDGILGVSIRCINIDDIDNLIGYDKTKYGQGTMGAYGNKVTYSWDLGNLLYSYGTTTEKTNTDHDNEFYYYDAETKKVMRSLYAAGEEITTLTSTYYSYNIEDYMEKELVAYDMLDYTYDNKYYWLASYFTNMSSNGAAFGIHYVDGGDIGRGSIFTSYGAKTRNMCNVRAIVTLASDIVLTENTATRGTYDIVLVK